MKPFIVMQILARAQEIEATGQRVIHMEVGEPDLPPPEACRRAAVEAIDGGRTRYTNSLGMAALRDAISAYYQRVYGEAIHPGRIVATTGTSGAFLLVLGDHFRRGDRVAVTDPGYPCYPNFMEFLGLEAVRIPVHAADGFRPRLDALDAALAQGPIAGMILTSPSNPTGAVLTRDDYRAVLARVPRVISDEIYHGIWLDPDVEVFTGAELGERVTVIDGFSKKWSMTGSRLGWTVVPPEAMDRMVMLTQNLTICPPTSAQYAGVAALTQGLGAVTERQAVYRARADYLIPAVEALGLRIPARPRGAFYLYADVSALTDDSYALCFDLLERAHVAITPGADFGEHLASRHVRFSLATALPDLEEGVHRLARYLTQRGLRPQPILPSHRVTRRFSGAGE